MRFSLFSGLLWCCLVMPARADTLYWANGTTGNFSDKNNWTDEMLPGAGDTVVFDGNVLTSQHTIVFSGNTTAATEAEADMCTTIFQLTGGYTTGPFTPASGGGLVELTGGTMNAQSVMGLDLLISGATLAVSSTAGPSTCTVDGSQSSLQCSGSVQAGTFTVSGGGSITAGSIAPVGGGYFTVTTGGSLNVSGSAAPQQINLSQGGTATAGALTCPVVTVDGTGSSLQLSGPYAPAGADFLTELTITNGGMFGCTTVDVTNNLSGTITGSGSLWNTSGMLYFGKHVTLTIQNGGQLSLGGTMTSDASLVEVQGTNSIVSAPVAFVGISGTGGAAIDVSQGGQVQSGSAFLGDNPAAPAFVSVHDPGSSWITQNAGLAIGAAGAGTLTVSNGGLVQVQGSPGANETFSVGFGTGPGGTVNIQDSGTMLDANSGSVIVGQASSGQINISHNAVMNAGALTIGGANVTGVVKAFTGGTLSLLGDVTINSGQFQLFSGAQAGQLATSQHLAIGGLNGRSGFMTVDGAGTIFSSAGLMIVGESGSGFLTVTNGGQFVVDYASAGANPGTGIITVTGTGSLLRVTTFLTAGGSLNSMGPGTITVTNNGLAQVDDQFTVLPQGTINVGGGSINIGSSNAVAAGVLRVSAGGALHDAGTVNGQILVGLGGIFYTGDNDGTALINGGFELDSGAQLSMNVSGTNSSTGYDVLDSTGTVSLAGTLVLNFLNGFAPRAGQSFAFLKFGSLNGSFSQIQLNGVASGFQYEIQTNNNALVLVALNDGVATSPPLLSIAAAGGNVSVSWPAAAAGFTLQSSTNLGSTNWTSISTTTNQFTAPASGGSQFFRLFKPGS